MKSTLKMDSITRQFLVKVAYPVAPLTGTAYNSGYAGLSPTDYQSKVMGDVQNYGHLSQASPEWARASKGWDPNYAEHVRSIGRRFQGAADDPEFVSNLSQGKADFQPLLSGLGAQSMSTWDKTKYMARQGINAVNPFLPAQALQAGKNIVTAVRGAGGGIGAMGKNVDLNSPLMRNLKARGATSYMSNKIDSMTSGMGSFGSGLRGFLNFLLGMGSKIPGYETLANKVMDWTGQTAKMQNALTPNAAVPQKAAFALLPSNRLYAHYRVVHKQGNTEVLSLWNQR